MHARRKVTMTPHRLQAALWTTGKVECPDADVGGRAISVERSGAAAPQASTGAGIVDASWMTAMPLIVAGVLGLALGSFSYTHPMHETQIGPVVLSVTEQAAIELPLWADLGAIAAGAGLLLFGGKRG